MIDRSFVEKIEQMSAEPGLCLIDGIQYSAKKLYRNTPPVPAPLSCAFLQALVEYCAKELNHEQDYIIHIAGPGAVYLLTRLDPVYRHREELVAVNAERNGFQFGSKHAVDTFIIQLQASFVQDDTTAAILKLVGNLTSSKEVSTKDDGVTQRVEAKVGLAKVENVSVPNPVTLRPFRTFPEIEQPASQFVLRIDADHRCALYEADGGTWKIAAVAGVRAWLDNALKSAGAPVDRITILS